MEINEAHADAIYEEEREKRAGVDEFTGAKRPAPMPPMSPFEYVEKDVEDRHDSDAEEFLEDSADEEVDEYGDRGLSRDDFF